jgi:hypothetical protein
VPRVPDGELVVRQCAGVREPLVQGGALGERHAVRARLDDVAVDEPHVALRADREGLAGHAVGRPLGQRRGDHRERARGGCPRAC